MRTIVILSDRSRMKIPPPLFSIFVVLGAGSAQAHDPVARGQALVAEFCGRCHAIGVKGKSRHSDAPPFRNLGPRFRLIRQRVQRGDTGQPVAGADRLLALQPVRRVRQEDIRTGEVDAGQLDLQSRDAGQHLAFQPFQEGAPG